MKWITIRKDFYVAENFFTREVACRYLQEILALGSDPIKGFHHPSLKPNRFHVAPMYPVDQYMGLGMYWNPLDYLYYPTIPQSGHVPVLPIPEWLMLEAKKIVLDRFPHFTNWQAQAVLVNYYRAGKKMSWHVDKEEEDKFAPVVGINFGSSCRFYYENEFKEEASFILPSNSVYIFGNEARLMRHAVGSGYKKSLSMESHGLLADGERLNLTVRQVRIC
jgi:alkylated DNA repair dioxygenase AlkB